MKYFQEFKISQTLYDLILKHNLKNTIASNMADPYSYALNLNTMELVNKLEASLTSQLSGLKDQAENKIEEIVSQEFNIITIDSLLISTELEHCSVEVVSNHKKISLPQFTISSEELINQAVSNCKELFWVVDEASPLFSKEFKTLILQIQFFNHILS